MLIEQAITAAEHQAAERLVTESEPRRPLVLERERLEGLLERACAPEPFPALYETVASGALDDEDDPDAEFNFGLARTLDGIDALVRARA